MLIKLVEGGGSFCPNLVLDYNNQFVGTMHACTFRCSFVFVKIFASLKSLNFVHDRYLEELMQRLFIMFLTCLKIVVRF